MSTKNKISAIELIEKRLSKPFTLGSLIEATRLGEEMTQIEFAKQLKISRSHLNDIEKGRKVVSPGRAARFARILGYSEVMWISYALQAILDKEGLKYKASVKIA